MEINPLVRSGKMVRVFVCEVEPGDVTAFGETVERVERHGDARVVLHMTNGSVQSFGRVGGTILVEACGPVEDDCAKSHCQPRGDDHSRCWGE